MNRYSELYNKVLAEYHEDSVEFSGAFLEDVETMELSVYETVLLYKELQKAINGDDVVLVKYPKISAGNALLRGQEVLLEDIIPKELYYKGSIKQVLDFACNYVWAAGSCVLMRLIKPQMNVVDGVCNITAAEVLDFVA